MAKRRSSYYDHYWPSYSSSGPIRVQDGIKAKSQHGRFVQNWWADRWIEALVDLMDRKRLSRGRSYARRGQVLDIDIGPGEVTSRVQGSRARPYDVRIRLRPLSDGQWDAVFGALAEQAIYAAQLLAGEMPPDIGEVFDSVRVSLFPETVGDLKTSCSCPDYANPCKHIAAVYYLLGERFDQDPFLLLTLRGRTKEEVAAELRGRRAQGADAVGESGVPYSLGAVGEVEVTALEESLDGFWDLGPEADSVALALSAPQVEMALLKRLGVPDFVDARAFWAQMERVYAEVTTRALDIAFADAGPGDTEPDST